MFNFYHFSMHVEILMSLFARRNSHYRVVNFVLLKVLGRPCSQTIDNQYVSVVVEGILKER